MLFFFFFAISDSCGVFISSVLILTRTLLTFLTVDFRGTKKKSYDEFSSHRRRTRKIKRGEPVGLKRYCHAAENQIPSNLHSVLFAWDQTGSRDEDFRLHRSSSLVFKSQIRPPLHLPHSLLIKRSSAGTLLFKARRALPSLSPPPLLPSLGKGRDLTGSPSIKLKSPLENPKESERSDLRRVSDLDITDASSPLWMGVTLLYYIFTPTFPTPPTCGTISDGS